MKKIKLFLSALMLMAFSVGNVWATLPNNPKWEAKALADIADGSTVIIISNSTTATNIALPAAGAGTSNPPKRACTVTTTDGVTTITPPTGTTLQDLAWTVSKQTSTWKFYVEGSTTSRLYLSGLSSNTAVRVGTAPSNYDQFVMGAGGKLLEVMNGENRGVRFVGPYDNSGSDWRSYNSETATNYKSAALTFYVLKVTPAISVEDEDGDPITALDFGTVKQYTKTGGVNKVLKSFKLKGENLTGYVNLSFQSSNFKFNNSDYPSGLNDLSIAPKAGKIDTTITAMCWTNQDAAYNTNLIVSSATSEFTTVQISTSIVINTAYSVSVAVNDEAMGSATIGGEASVYAVDGENYDLVATANPGYEFVNWTYENAKVEVVNSTAASTKAFTKNSDATITANFAAMSCTSLDAPVYYGYSIDYQSVRLAWNAVEHAEGYVVNIKQGETAIVTDELVDASTTEFTKDGLAANTAYTISVMAVGDGSTYCDANNPVLEKTYTTLDYPASILRLSENGVVRIYEGEHKVTDVITLPTEVETNVLGKVLVGWSKVEVAETDTKPTENFYEPGAEYTLNSELFTLYAVYAAGHDAIDEWQVATSVEEGDEIVFSTHIEYANMRTNGSLGSNTYMSMNASTYNEDKSKITALSENAFPFIIGGNATDGWTLKNGTNYLYMSGDKKISLKAEATTWSISINAETKIATVSQEYNNSTYTMYCNYGSSRFNCYTAKGSMVEVSLYKHVQEAANWSGYTTSGPKKLADPTFNVEAGTYTEAQSIELSAAEGDIYYTLDGSEPSATSTKYTAAIAISARGESTINAIAIAGENKSDVVSLTINLNLPYASLEELVAQGEKAANDVTVTLDVTIDDFNSNRKAIYLEEKGPNGNSAELYNSATAAPENWAKGGTLSGTITADWKSFGSGENVYWELDGVDWSKLTYKAPANIAWSAETAKAYLPADLIENTLPTLVNPDNVDVVYSVIGEDPEKVAEIDENGVITLKGAGTITVRASSTSTEYAHADADYTLIVYAPATKTIVGEVATEYEYGDEFDFSGLDVKVTYADDSEHLIQNDNINLSWYVTPGYVLKNGNVNVKAEGLDDFEVEQNYAVTVKTHSVTFENPEHGTLVIKNGDENIESGDAFVKTSEFTVVATPAEGYQLASLTAGGVDIMEAKSFVLGTTDVEVVATFEALPTPKYYLHGTAVGSWDPHASYDDAYVISGLEAGTEYMLKVTHEGTWDNPDHVKGFYNLNPHTAGIYTNNDGNVCFKLAEAGDVTVTYIADNTFTVAGNFAMPTIQLKGSWDWDTPIDMTIDGGVATCEVTLNAASNYEFGFVLGGFWTANNYNYHKGYTTTEGVTGQAGNMKLLTDGEGKYSFTWTFENNVMSITFPGAATAIDQVAGAEKPAKVLRDGMIFIQKDGKVYTVTGRLVK